MAPPDPRARELLERYFERKRLAKLGYTSPLSELSPLCREAFLVIDAEFDLERAKRAKKKP